MVRKMGMGGARKQNLPMPAFLNSSWENTANPRKFSEEFAFLSNQNVAQELSKSYLCLSLSVISDVRLLSNFSAENTWAPSSHSIVRYSNCKRGSIFSRLTLVKQ